MKENLYLLRGALTLDTKIFDDLKASPAVFSRGFTFVLALGLFVGIVLGLAGIAQGLTSNPIVEITTARQQIEQQLAQLNPPGASGQFTENFRMGFNIAERIVRELKAPLPRPAEVVFKNVGAMISYPFGWLGSLIFYGVIVQIAAKLLGGRGTIAQMLGVSSLAVAPHILDALGFIPCVGPLIGLVTLIWGAVVYVKATASAQALTLGRATLAAFAPIIIGFLLTLCSIITLGVVIAANSGR